MKMKMKMHMKNRRDIYLEEHFIVCDHQVNKNTKTLPNRQIQIQMAVFFSTYKRKFLIWFMNVWDRDPHTQSVSKKR